MIDIDLKPNEKKLKNFGLIASVFFVLWTILAYLKFHNLGWYIGFSGLTLYTLSCALTYHRALIPLYISLTVLAFPVGRVISHVILAVLFYLIFAPIGLILKLIGHDPMRRKINRLLPTYWHLSKHDKKPESYYQQF